MGNWIAIGYAWHKNPYILSDTSGDTMRFKTEVEAWAWINEFKFMYNFDKWKVIELD